MKEETIIIASWRPSSREYVDVEVLASVKGGLAIHKAVDGQGDDSRHTLTVVACGLALEHGKKRALQILRRALLETAIPWSDLTSKEAAKPYVNEMIRVMKSTR